MQIEQIEPGAFSFSEKRKNQTFQETHSKKLVEPSQSELCQTVLLLKKILPHRSLERSIIMLYEVLVKKKPPQQIYDNQLLQLQSKAQIISQKNVAITPVQLTKNYQKQDLIKKNFTNLMEQNKYKDKRLVAKSFVAKGYGHQFAIQQFAKAKFDPVDKNNFSFNKDIYKQTISAVITQAFRKLQSFLMQDCKKNITPLTKNDLKKLMTPLLSSSAFREHLIIFKKYLRLLFGLSNVTLIEGQSIKFYLEAFKHLNGGKSFTMEEVENLAREQHKKLEGTQIIIQNTQAQKSLLVNGNLKIQGEMMDNISDAQIAKIYIQHSSIQDCFSYFSTRFENINKFRLRLYSILRIIINKIQQLCFRNQLVEKFNEKILQYIFNSKKCQYIRIKLFSFFLNPIDGQQIKIIQEIIDLSKCKQQNEQNELLFTQENNQINIDKIDQQIKIKQQDSSD